MTIQVTKKSFSWTFLNKSLNLKIMSNIDNQILPYDKYCVAIKVDIQTRTFSICHIYFASITILKKHMQIHNVKSKKITPKKVIRCRKMNYWWF